MAHSTGDQQTWKNRFLEVACYIAQYIGNYYSFCLSIGLQKN
jgi:hypothetical protein